MPEETWHAARLIPPTELRFFRLAMTFPMGTKRGTGCGGSIDSVIDAVDVFYRDVVQGLKVWAPAAPRLRELPPEVPTSGFAAVLASTALSSQNEPFEIPSRASDPAEFN